MCSVTNHMITEIKKYVCIAMTMKVEDISMNVERSELTEVPAPGTSPEAPGGPGYISPDDEGKENEDSDEWTDFDGNTDGYSVPERKDDNLL